MNFDLLLNLHRKASNHRGYIAYDVCSHWIMGKQTNKVLDPRIRQVYYNLALGNVETCFEKLRHVV